MDITNMYNLKRRSPTRWWTGGIHRFFPWKVDGVFSDRRVVTEPKNGGAKESRRVRWNIHVAKIMGQNWSFSSNRTFTHILILNLRGLSKGDCSEDLNKMDAYLSQIADISDQVNKSIITQVGDRLKQN